MLKTAFILALGAFGLCACSAEGDLGGDLEIGGTEPAYWTVEIDHAQAKTVISILGEPSLEGGLPVKSRGEGDGVLMTSKTDQGDFVMTFTHKECFDGLAETARPWAVTATWKGETLSGCAVPKA
jgi:uncharacterized membrane protein